MTQIELLHPHAQYADLKLVSAPADEGRAAVSRQTVLLINWPFAKEQHCFCPLYTSSILQSYFCCSAGCYPPVCACYFFALSIIGCASPTVYLAAGAFHRLRLGCLFCSFVRRSHRPSASCLCAPVPWDFGASIRIPDSVLRVALTYAALNVLHAALPLLFLHLLIL